VARRVGRGIALLFHDRGTRRGEWSAARSGRTLPPGKTRYPFYRRLGGKSRPHQYSIPDRPARSQSLYRRSYRTHKTSGTKYQISYPSFVAKFVPMYQSRSEALSLNFLTSCKPVSFARRTLLHRVSKTRGTDSNR